MDTEGRFVPTSAADARKRYESLGPLAQTVVREVAKAMDLSADTYEERVTPEVVETAREVLFAGDLRVHVGPRAEFEEWIADRDVEVVEFGSEHVVNVAWHHAPVAGTVVATTFADERAAAVETLRRQAMGSVYRDVV
jgi:hypothetical protein